MIKHRLLTRTSACCNLEGGSDGGVGLGRRVLSWFATGDSSVRVPTSDMDPPLAQEHADAIVLSAFAIPDKHVGPSAHCQLDQKRRSSWRAASCQCLCQGMTSRRTISAKSRAAGEVRARVVLIGVTECSFAIGNGNKH